MSLTAKNEMLYLFMISKSNKNLSLSDMLSCYIRNTQCVFIPFLSISFSTPKVNQLCLVEQRTGLVMYVLVPLFSSVSLLHRLIDRVQSLYVFLLFIRINNFFFIILRHMQQKIGKPVQNIMIQKNLNPYFTKTFDVLQC